MVSSHTLVQVPQCSHPVSTRQRRLDGTWLSDHRASGAWPTGRPKVSLFPREIPSAGSREGSGHWVQRGWWKSKQGGCVDLAGPQMGIEARAPWRSIGAPSTGWNCSPPAAGKAPPCLHTCQATALPGPPRRWELDAFQVSVGSMQMVSWRKKREKRARC